MCLYVRKSFVKSPIYEVDCIKQLTHAYGIWMTPYTHKQVQCGTGWFMPCYPCKRYAEYETHDSVGEGYIHAYALHHRYRHKALKKIPTVLRDGDVYTFRAVARYVVATDDYNDELVCKALYIPAFDKTGTHRHAVLDLGN